MKLKTRIFTAALAFALILGAMALTPPAQAYEPLCFICKWVPFNGSQCHDLLGTGEKTACNDYGGVCRLLGDTCNGLTVISR